MSSDNLKIMTFNLRYGTADDGEHRWENRKDLTAGVIQQCTPDLIGLQEALLFQLEFLKSRMPEYAILGKPRLDGDREGETAAIMYREPEIQLVDHGTFWFSETPEIPGSSDWGSRHPRVCTWGIFGDGGDHHRFSLYNLHLDNASQQAREKSVQLLTEVIGSGSPADPVIVTGDFNADEDNVIIKYMQGENIREMGNESRALAFKDVFADLDDEPTVHGTIHNYTGRTDGPRIDYIFVSREVEVHSAEIVRYSAGGRYPSDHFPVKAELKW